ncbi:unnamed protein product [Ectocarpus fasciculatus]
MNVMIPMAGRGSRFSAEGYRLPKPLINIVGRPMLYWLLDNLKFEPEDTLWVGVQQDLEGEYAIASRLRTEFPTLDIRVVSIDFQTRGAAETLFIMLQHMSPAEIRRKSISLDCDTIYFSDVLGSFRACASGCGSSFYFEDEGNKPIFSYIEFEPGTDKIVRIREKEAISRHANTGAYAFPCGDRLRRACREVLDNPVGKAGEFYTSSIIEGMIQAGQKFVGIHVPNFFSVGTPAQLRSFLGLIQKGVVAARRKTRVFFELDRPLHMARSGTGADRTASVRSGDLDKHLLPTTRNTGTSLEDPVSGQPAAGDTTNVGGRTGNAHEDMQEEIGRCLHESDIEEAVSSCCAQDFMPPRSFNRITCSEDNLVTKSAPLEYLRGELHFYRSIPPELVHLFPTVVEVNDDPALAMPSMTMTKIDGVSFSHLVTNHCVTRGRCSKLLRSLLEIHEAKKIPRGPHGEVGTSGPGEENNGPSSKDGIYYDGVVIAPCSEPLHREIFTERLPSQQNQRQALPASTICANLHEKARVLQRLGHNEAVYAGFEGIDIPAMSRIILSYLRSYQEGARFRRADFVHGDPVFSNCLQNKEGGVAFVDMRGALGDLLCTEGDTNYDLAKVYQSLCGYDFIIMDKDVDPNAAEMLRDLEQNVFWPFVRENYAGTKPEDIVMLAASHFLSIVPLHENRGHQARFLRACNDILTKWNS